jgi:hypothetical protein
VVESAIADLSATGGGTIRFSAGKFDLGSQFIWARNLSNITFDGAGIDRTFIRNFSRAAADTEPFKFYGSTNNVVVSDLTVSAGGPFRSTSDALDFDAGNNSRVVRVKVARSRGRGIVFDGKDAGRASAKNVVRDCVVGRFVRSDGIELLASTNNLVEGCRITGVDGHGIQLTKASSVAAQPNKVSSYNVIRNNVIKQAGYDGVNVNGGRGNLIARNRILNSSDVRANRDGIRIRTGNGGPCNANVVRYNTATDTQRTKTQRYGLAILHASCWRTVVRANKFRGNRVGAVLDLGTATRRR